MSTHMRDKTVHCDKCHTNCTITANLDRGTVVAAKMPKDCKSPAKCIRVFRQGIFDRPFGERLVRPLEL